MAVSTIWFASVLLWVLWEKVMLQFLVHILIATVRVAVRQAMDWFSC